MDGRRAITWELASKKPGGEVEVEAFASAGGVVTKSVVAYEMGPIWIPLDELR